jgi:cytidylate kinase
VDFGRIIGNVEIIKEGKFMGRQMIIAISREYGSGGHHIARALAERFGIALYDHNLLDEMCREKGLDPSSLSRYDEVPKKAFLSRTVRGMSSSPEEAVANLQFDFLKQKAASGESFVVVGRCAEHVLRDSGCIIPIFVLGDYDVKVKWVMENRQMTEEQAREAIARHDSRRKAYHNHYCDIKWGDSRHYDLCVNSSRLGLDITTDMLERYIRERVRLMEEGK